jgi:hypothetical protein
MDWRTTIGKWFLQLQKWHRQRRQAESVEDGMSSTMARITASASIPREK